MSTTAHTVDEVQGRDEPDRVFRRYVFNNPEICSSCFRRLKANESHLRAFAGVTGHDLEPKASRAESIRAHKTKPGEIGPEGPLRGTRQVDNTAIAKYPTRTVCEDCGAIAGRADSDPLSRREALSRAKNLCSRLRELGEPVRLDLLKHAVGHLKSLEDYASLDTEVFEAATTVCVRRARKRP
ncbi:hypothetical protein [Natrinema ejinorense]|uniref:Uncharacterized protein n=1 Tax=Natrinema ejinorense TaxID=373386 RepID=A0A2A5R0E3_9EURY|nr:hypothetical protein [Natrinema ejinorense]PCR92560.1 hypothetical protein CP557_01365 [Natrinema ejinorense]